MKITFRDRPVIFVDLEASGLGRDTYPIEVGWSEDDEQAPSSFLIRPPSEWLYADFSAAALAVHGIGYERLISHGVEIHAACSRLEAAWTDAILVSDCQAMDERWLRRLYDAAGQRYPWRLMDFHVLDAALAMTLGDGFESLAAIAIAAERKWPVPHRAGPDAARLNKIARAIVDPNFRATLHIA